MRRSIGVALSIVAGVLLGGAGVVVVEPRLPTSPTVIGLRVDGDELPLGADPQAFVQVRARAFAAQPVVLVHGDKRFETTMAELGGTVDVEATVEAAVAVGHEGSIFRRLGDTAAARRGERNVPLVYRFDDELARKLVMGFAPELERPAVDARLDLERHAKVPDRPGQELDVAATLAALEESFAGAEEGAELDLVTREVPAQVTLGDLESIDVSKVLASYETRFSPYKRGRSVNVELAASKLNGMILPPLGTLSFNQRVGPRTREAGFQEAPEIVGDELSTGIGGGVCQVASTLHGAAIYGGLAITERQSHSRISGYIPLGLDATVSYPKVDLKLQNPHNFTIVVHAFTPEPGLLRVELLGGEAVQEVQYRYGVGRVEDYVRRITVKRFLKPGTGFRRQKGTRGMDVHSTVTIRFKDGRVEERRYYSGYRPTPEVFWVAPDYDEQELPPLPQHAKGVEGRIPEDGSDVYETG